MSEILTVPEVSEYTRLSKSTIYDLTKAGKMPHIRIGSRILIRKEALDEWLNKHSLDEQE
jgi:excisionase family DNA binding protein